MNMNNNINFNIEYIIYTGDKSYCEQQSNTYALSSTRKLMLEEFTNLYIEKNNMLPIPYYNKYYINKEKKITYKIEHLYICPSGIFWNDKQPRYGWIFQFIAGHPKYYIRDSKNWKKINVGDIDLIIEIVYREDSDLIQNLEIANYVFSILTDRVIRYIENEGKDKFNKLVKYQRLTEEGIDYNDIIQSIED